MMSFGDLLRVGSCSKLGLVKEEHLFIESSLFLAPVLLELLLQLELLQHLSHQIRGEYGIRKSEGSIMPCNDHLSDGSSREPFSSLSDLLNNLGSDALHPDKFLASVYTAGVFVEELELVLGGLGRRAVLDQVVEQHRPPLVHRRQPETYDLIDTIVYGLVQLLW